MTCLVFLSFVTTIVSLLKQFQGLWSFKSLCANECFFSKKYCALANGKSALFIHIKYLTKMFTTTSKK